MPFSHTSLALLAVFGSYAMAQDNTVRTGSGSESSDAQKVESIANTYEQVMNALEGQLSINNASITSRSAKLEQLRRTINNLETIIYKTVTVELQGYDPNTDDSGDNADGGGCG
ncbi:MAG: hypothetical protein GC134_00805 [Proteobacteria bacterium]|nr:hypothetical protein [Pseudomonadota bacterium]